MFAKSAFEIISATYVNIVLFIGDQVNEEHTVVL